MSARTEAKALGGAGVHDGDPITNFKYLINVDNLTVIRSAETKPELQDKLAELQKRNANWHTYVIAYKVAESRVKREWAPN